jgi:hypothetical protein
MSTIKVNTVTKRTGSTLTLGESGTTVTLACGATQTGFGRAGSVNWCSTIYTNSPGTVTATSGKGFFLNTTSGAITINLPSSPSFGDIVAIKDYANTFQSNNVTVGRGGSKISGDCQDAILSTKGDSITLVFTDSTRGWLNVNTEDTIQGIQHVAATGGTVLTVGDFKTHVFTSSGCFQVTNAGNALGSNKIDYFVVGGGGGGGVVEGGGGAGAGGFRVSNEYSLPGGLTSPLANPTGLTASVATFPITVGAGGTAGSPPATDSVSGSPAVFSTITSTGGGRGGRWNSPGDRPGGDGGSGGGGSGRAPGTAYIEGSGNTPPVSPPQGNPGGRAELGSSNPDRGGGGGGAGAVGTAVTSAPAGPGGAGSFIDANFIGPTAPSYGTPGPVSNTRYFAGGGGGGKDSDSPNGGTGGCGANGGGNGGSADGSPRNATAGTANTGGGGGGQGSSSQPGSGAGGSGIVILRYKFQN